MKKTKSGYFSNFFTTVNNIILKNKLLRNIKSLYYYIDWFILLFIKAPNSCTNSKKKVIVVYNLSLGDSAMFNCALKNIRKIYPVSKYELTIICQEKLNEIYEATNLFDNVLYFNFTKFAINLKERHYIFKELRKVHYDILLDPIGIEECSTNLLLARAICSDKKIGIINYGRNITCSEKIYKNIYTDFIEINDEKIHLIDHYYSFFNKIGKLNDNPQLTSLPSVHISKNIPEKYFIVFPSASTIYKKWPVERFAEITKKIHNETKLPLVICGTDVDVKTNNQLINLIKDSVDYIDLTNKTFILEYVDLIQKAQFIVTNDTGIYHVATVSETPVAIISGAYTWDRYLTYNFKGHELYRKPYVIANKWACANCNNRCIKKNKYNTWPCLYAITTKDAWVIIKEMLKGL